jgi:uncharacterized membrane protein
VTGRVSKAVRIIAVLLGAAVGAVVVALLVIVAVAHAPSVQRAAWNRAAQAVREASGWELSADTFSARLLWSPSIRVAGARLEAEGRTVARADQVTVHLGWRSLLALSLIHI